MSLMNALYLRICTLYGSEILIASLEQRNPFRTYFAHYPVINLFTQRLTTLPSGYPHYPEINRFTQITYIT